jgi:hypothetical protein
MGEFKFDSTVKAVHALGWLKNLRIIFLKHFPSITAVFCENRLWVKNFKNDPTER